MQIVTDVSMEELCTYICIYTCKVVSREVVDIAEFSRKERSFFRTHEMKVKSPIMGDVSV